MIVRNILKMNREEILQDIIRDSCKLAQIIHEAVLLLKTSVRLDSIWRHRLNKRLRRTVVYPIIANCKMSVYLFCICYENNICLYFCVGSVLSLRGYAMQSSILFMWAFLHIDNHHWKVTYFTQTLYLVHVQYGATTVVEEVARFERKWPKTYPSSFTTRH